MAEIFYLLILVFLISLDAHDDDFGGDSYHQIPFFKNPDEPKDAYFCETFLSQEEFESRWIKSQAKKDFTDENISKYDGEWILEEPIEKMSVGDLGLVLKSKAKHHAISSKLKHPFVFGKKTFIVQFEAKLQRGLDCGGAYIKLLIQSDELNLSDFHDRTPYVIMFGPDKCGSDMKIHFIFRHRNPITKKFEEKHAIQPSTSLEAIFKDKITHLYTLIVRADNSFSIMVDRKLFVEGDLLHDMSPSVNPPREISDPNDTKPIDWEEREMIPDPNATKPENWDEEFGSEFVPDRKAKIPEGWLEGEEEWIPDWRAIKPSDWDEDIDGHWEPPMIINPACERAVGCGEWKPPLVKNTKFKGPWTPPNVKNPSYKGPWSPRKILNPNYFFDPLPYNMSSIGALGIEIWSMSVDILFDNFLITHNEDEAQEWADKTWRPKFEVEKLRDASSKVNTIEAIVEAATERPWLWVPIILAIVVPTLIFIVCCCGSPQRTEQGSERMKKFDDAQGASRKVPRKVLDEQEERVRFRGRVSSSSSSSRNGPDPPDSERFYSAHSRGL